MLRTASGFGQGSGKCIGVGLGTWINLAQCCMTGCLQAVVLRSLRAIFWCQTGEAQIGWFYLGFSR